jgi:hypothetical protein
MGGLLGVAAIGFIKEDMALDATPPISDTASQ